MSSSTKISLSNKADAKAFFFAVLTSLVFIVLLNAVFPRPVRKTRASSNHRVNVPTPTAPNKLLEAKPSLARVNEQLRVVPQNFKNVDFKNHSYRLQTPEGLSKDLVLSEGELQLPENTGWFSLQDVFYKDVTGDRIAEAIVRLSVVKCAGSCDGGADLLYIYGMRNGKLETLWQYQTGTRAYGCSLKSLAITNAQLVMELFGWCPKPGSEDPGEAKFVVTGFTFTLFEYDGWRFAKKDTQFFTTPSSTNVMNYEPAIRLF